MSDFVHLHNHTHYSVLDGLQKIPEMLDRPYPVELRGAGARRGNHRFTGGIRDEMHMKIAQEIIQSADQTVDKMARPPRVAKPCTFIQTMAMFYKRLYRFERLSTRSGDNSRTRR